MDTGPAKSRNGDTGPPEKTARRLAGDNEVNLTLPRENDDGEEWEDVATGLQPVVVEPKIDVNTLKNEILTDGMQAAASGNVEALQELILKFGKVHIPNDTLINMYNLLGYTMLHYAVMYKRMNCIEALIELGADIERPTNLESRDTPLLLAIRFLNSFPPSFREEDKKTLQKSKMETVKFLIAQGCKINSANKANESPIVLATKLQNVELVEELVKRSELDVNTRSHKGKTPLHMVAATDDHKIALVLLRHGADVHLKDTSGSTPLHIACYQGSTSIVELIFRERPQSNDVLLTQADRAGNIPLMIAKKSPNNSAAIINFLISYDVDLQHTNELSETLLHMFGPTDNAESSMIITKREPSLLSCRNINRQTPLHVAAMMGHKESLLVFIRNGADITARDNDEMMPLMLAIQAGNIEIISVMLDLGCDIHAEAKNEKSIITWAIEKEYTSLVKALIDRGQEAATQFVDDEENTFLHVAAKSGSLRTIQVLLGSLVTEGLVYSENKEQHTPLHVAAKYGNLQCLKELIDGDADIAKVDKEDNNALHIACIHGQLDVVQFLLQSGLSPELSNGKLGTPLSCAAYHGHDHIVSFLLGRDASCNGSYTDIKVSPLLLATQQGHIKVVKILLDYPRIDVTLTNKAGYNALAEAIVKGYKEIALTIIISDHWDKAMRMCTGNNMTPMRLLIMHMPDLAQIILDKCIVASEEETGGEITHITYNYEFIDDFDDPELGVVEKFLLEKALAFKSEHQEGDIPLAAIQQNDVSMFEHPTILQVHSRWGPNVYNKDSHTMALMVKSERIELLQHPLVAELLNHKWNKITLPSLLISMGLYVVFLGFLTSYVLLLPNPRGSVCSKRNLTDDCPEYSSSKRSFLGSATVFLVLFCVVNLALEGLQIFSRRLEYLKEWRNYMEIGLSVLTIGFVLNIRVHDCFCPSSSQWQLGCVVIFLAWFDFVLLMRNVPFAAIPINMLLSITRSFLQVIALPVLLIISFGIPLFLLFHEPGSGDSFESVGITFLKSIVMTTGEYDFEDNLVDRDVFYPFLYYFWIVFVIIMPVLFNNLLVGLAVGDTQVELEKATLTKLSLQVLIALEIEERLPSVRLYFSEKFQVVKRNHKHISKIPFLSGISFDHKVKAVHDSNETQSNLIEEYQKKNPLEEIRERLKQQDNELHLLKEMVEKGFKANKTLTAQPLIERSTSGLVAVTEEGEVNKSEITPGQNGNTDTTVNQGPELPLPVPDLL